MRAFTPFISLFLIMNKALGIDISDLQPLLSSDASISYDASEAPRWSEFPAPNPGAVVNVAAEDDVLATVQYCVERDIQFLAQNGGHGCAITFNLGQNGVVINLSRLNHVRVNDEGTELWLEGGALVSDVVAAAYASNTTVPTPSCNCIGQLGAGLGAGYGNLVGVYGLIIDNLISVNLVTPAGKLITVTPKSDPELWFALRGAGPNFGVVTSATMRSYPVDKSGLNAWLGTLTFSEEKLEDLVQAIDSLTLEPEMVINLVFTASGSTDDFSISIIALLFYYGTDAAAKESFSSIYELGPETEESSIQPYDHWNDPQDGGCARGQRKQRFGAGLTRMVPATWRTLYDEYKAFLQETRATKSSLIMNATPWPPKSESLLDAAYPFRDTIKYNTWAQPTVDDPSLDAAAKKWGLRARDLLRSTSGLATNTTYVNGAYGDEELSVVYGDNVDRLRKLKTQMDPEGRFNQWFPLS